MSVDIEGNLKDKYEGKVRQRSYGFDGEIKNEKILKVAAFAFGTPIYIGISLNLERRLSEHKKKLSDHMTTGEILDIKDEIKTDTDEESKHFAQRIASYLNKRSTVGSNSLFIKTVEVDNDVKFSELQEVEKFINRTFTPSLGLK
jgi:hypothetical protein